MKQGLWIPTLFCAVALAQDAPVCDPNTLGAQADGVTKDTAAIQSAIDMCAAAGGGIVWLSSGVYLTAPLVLKSNVTLQVDAGVTLLGSSDASDYLQPTAR
jgi:polygalacturonase